MPDPFVLVPAGTLDGQDAGASVTLPDEVVHHLGRVLRLRDATPVVVADGAGARATGTWAGAQVELATRPVQDPSPTPRVHVWQALGKGRKHDEVVRVLTELGVDAVTAVVSERTVVDLGAKAEKVRTRWAAVARSACEQARRSRLPTLDGPTPVAELLADLGRRPCLLAHVGATTDPLAVAAATHDTDEVVVAVGPEGGWTDAEVAAFVAAGATPVALGPTVLRTEHAATVLGAVVLAATGRLRA